jgi:hypothetical protein
LLLLLLFVGRRNEEIEKKIDEFFREGFFFSVLFLTKSWEMYFLVKHGRKEKKRKEAKTKKIT